MGSNDFWLQPNKRRFNLEASKDGINIDDASKKLNISKNMLSSIFIQADGNQNGVIEDAAGGENELENFLAAVNEKFTKFVGEWGRNTQEVNYEDTNGNSVKEQYDEDGNLVKKIITKNIYISRDIGSRHSEYIYKDGHLSELIEKDGDDEKRTTFEYAMGRLSKSVTTEGNKQTTRFYLNGKETEVTVAQDGKFIEKSYENTKGEKVHISLDGENVVEHKIMNNGTNLVTVYGGTFEEYESGKAPKIGESVINITAAKDGQLQMTSYDVEYDGKGNTIVYAKAGDGWEKLAKQFNTTVSELKRLNVKIAQKEPLQAAQPIVVPGIIPPDSPTLNNRRDVDRAKSIHDASQVELDKAVENIYSSAIDEELLTQDFNNVYDYARYLAVYRFMQKPEEPTFEATVNTIANELRLINGDSTQYKKGNTVKIIVSRTQKLERSLFEAYGIKPNEENAVFFTRYAGLSNKERAEVMDALEYCRKNKITDKVGMNKEIQRLCNGLNLFDTDIKALTRPSDIQIRRVMAQSVLQQLMQIVAMFNSANPNKGWSSDFDLVGAGAIEICAFLKHWLQEPILPNVESGSEISKELQKKVNLCLELIGICDREEAFQRNSVEYKVENGTRSFEYEFNRIYSTLTGASKIDYDGVANYLQISAEMSRLVPQQRTDVDGVTGQSIPVDAEKYKELEQELQKYQSSVNILIQGDFENRIQEWAQNCQQIGGLTDFATTLVMMYLTGGFAAIGRGSLAAGSYVARGASISLSNMAQGRIGGRILSMGMQSAITSAINVQTQLITNSALTATAFSISKFCRSASDFYIDEQEWSEMCDNWTGLAKFTYVNGLFIGPATQFIAKSVTGLAHTERAAQAILNNAVGKSTTFGSLMTTVLENAGNIEKGIQMPLSFAMNMEYMAKADNLTYEEAFNSLLHMEGISKIIAGIMGQKGITLPPEKVKTVSARVEDYKVDIARFDREVNGKRAPELLIRVTSPEGEVVGEFKDFEAFKSRMSVIVEKEVQRVEQNNGEKTESGKFEPGENPAPIAAEKVKKQWLGTDLNVPAAEEKVDLFNLDQEAGLKETPEIRENEVTSLIFRGQLEEALAMKYDALADVLSNFAVNHSLEISRLYESCKDDTEMFANEFLNMLSKEYGDAEYRPEIVTFEADGKKAGGFNFVTNQIRVKKGMSKDELCKTLIHEYTHAIQFLDVMKNEGVQGITDMIKNDPKLPENLKGLALTEVLNNKYYRYLASRTNTSKPAQGSVDDYLARVYKDEFTNPQKTDEYLSQLTELEAFFLENNNALLKALGSFDYFHTKQDGADGINNIKIPQEELENIPSGVKGITKDAEFKAIFQEEIMVLELKPELLVDLKIVTTQSPMTAKALLKAIDMLKKNMPRTYEYIRQKFLDHLVDTESSVEDFSAVEKNRLFDWFKTDKKDDVSAAEVPEAATLPENKPVRSTNPAYTKENRPLQQREYIKEGQIKTQEEWDALLNDIASNLDESAQKVFWEDLEKSGCKTLSKVNVEYLNESLNYFVRDALMRTMDYSSWIMDGMPKFEDWEVEYNESDFKRVFLYNDGTTYAREMRGESPVKPEAQEAINHLFRIISQSEPLDKPMTTYRVIKDYPGFIEQLIEGGTIKDDAFISSSSEYGSFLQYWNQTSRTKESFVLRITLPEGTKVLNCNGSYKPILGRTKYMRYGGIKEYDLAPSEMKIKKIDWEHNVIDVEYVIPEWMEKGIEPSFPENTGVRLNSDSVQPDVKASDLPIQTESLAETKPFVPGPQVSEWLIKLQKVVNTGVLNTNGKQITLTKDAQAIIQNAINMVNEGKISENVIRALMSRKSEGLWEDAIQDISQGTSKEDIYKKVEQEYAEVSEQEAMYDLYNNYGIEETSGNAKQILIQKRYESRLQLIEDIKVFNDFMSENKNAAPLSVVRYETGTTAVNSIMIQGKSLADWLKECESANDYSALCEAINKENPSYTFDWMAGTSLDKNFDNFKKSRIFKWNISAETGDARGMYTDIIRADQYSDEVEWLMAKGTKVIIERAWVDENGLLNIDAKIEKEAGISDKKQTRVNERLNEGVNVAENTEFQNLENAQAKLKQDNVSYEIITDKNGNKLIRIVSSYNMDAVKGMTDIKYNVFVFDKDGKCIKQEKDIPSEVAEKQYSNFHSSGAKIDIIDNSKSNTSAPVYSTILPVPSVLKKYYQSIKDKFSSFMGSGDELKYKPAKNIGELVKQIEKLDCKDFSRADIQEMFRGIELSEENLNEYSKMIAILKQNSSSVNTLKGIIDYIKQEQKTPSEVNSFIQTMISAVDDVPSLFSEESAGHKANIIRDLMDVKRSDNMADVIKLVQAYTKFYGKQSEYFVGVVITTYPEYTDPIIRLMEKYSSDPEMKGVVSPAGGHIALLPLIEAKDEAEMVRRIKVMQKLVRMCNDNSGQYGKIKRSMLTEEDPDVFDKKMQRLERIKDDMEVIGDMYSSKDLLHAQEILELSDEAFENIYKRDLFNKFSSYDISFVEVNKAYSVAKYAVMSDEVYERISKRGLDAEQDDYLIELTDEEYNNYVKRGIGDKVKDVYKREFFAKMSDADWQIIDKYGVYSGQTENIIKLLNMGEGVIRTLHERGLLQVVADLYKNEELFDKYVNLPDSEWKVIQERKLTEVFPNRQGIGGIDLPFRLGEIEELRQVSEQDWPKVRYLLTLDRGYVDPNKIDGWNGKIFYRSVQPFEVRDVIELAKLSKDDFDFLNNSGALTKLKMVDIRTLLDMRSFIEVKDVKDLTVADNRRLASILVKNNESLFDKDFQAFIKEKFGLSIIPKNQQQYCSLLSSAVRNGVMEFNPATKEQQAVFEKSLSAMGQTGSAFLKADLESPDFKLELEYPREEFMKDVMSALEGLTNTEKQKIMDYFGFEVYTNQGKLVISGYPRVLRSDMELTSPQGKKVQKLVERFTDNNKVSVKNNPELSKMLNDIFEAFPELKGIIGKVQHGMHDYSVDVHTLKVLQGVMSNPDFASLSASDKKILTISTLMHDISKKEMEIDKQHPQNSATEAYQLLSKMELTPEERESIYKIIKHHDWLEQYNQQGITDAERTVITRNLAFALKDGNNFKLASMLAEADLKGVQRGGSFYNEYKAVLKQGIEEISGIVNNLKSTEIYIPLARLPKASELIVDGKIVEERVIKGHKVRILHLRKGQDLSSVGFPKGTMSDDIQLLYHGCAHNDSGEDSSVLELIKSFEDPNSDAVLSHSLLSTYNPQVYAPYGVVNYTSGSHIIAGMYCNIGSGYNTDKVVSKLIERFVYGDSKEDRAYFPNQMKEKLNLTDAQYVELYDKIAGMTMTELRQSMPDVAAAMDDILYETEQARQTAVSTGFNGQKVSEFLVYKLMVQATACPYGSKYLDDMPEFLLKLNEERDIIIVCND